MRTITLTVNDDSMLSSVKKVCQMIKGVDAVKVSKPKTYDVTKTAGYREAMEDIKAGRVYTYDSANDFFKAMGL